MLFLCFFRLLSQIVNLHFVYFGFLMLLLFCKKHLIENESLSTVKAVERRSSTFSMLISISHLCVFLIEGKSGFRLISVSRILKQELSFYSKSKSVHMSLNQPVHIRVLTNYYTIYTVSIRSIREIHLEMGKGLYFDRTTSTIFLRRIFLRQSYTG